MNLISSKAMFELSEWDVDILADELIDQISKPLFVLTLLVLAVVLAGFIGV